jgi:hypothetical protein
MDLWVDGRGRLVQVRTTIRQVVPPVPRPATGAQPGGVPDPVDLSGTIVTSATLRLSDFGLPVHISVPHPLAETGSFGVAIGRATSCPAGRH